MSDLDRIKALAGLATDTVAEAGCDCDCGESPCVECGEDHHEVKEAVGSAAECFYDMQDAFAGGEAEGAHKVLIDELVRYLSGDQLEDFCDDFKRHYDMDIEEGNAYIGAVRKAKAAGMKKGDKVKGPDGNEITLERRREALPGDGSFVATFIDLFGEDDGEEQILKAIKMGGNDPEKSSRALYKLTGDADFADGLKAYMVMDKFVAAHPDAKDIATQAWKNTGGDLYAMAGELGDTDLASAFNAMAGISESEERREALPGDGSFVETFIDLYDEDEEEIRKAIKMGGGDPEKSSRALYKLAGDTDLADNLKAYMVMDKFVAAHPDAKEIATQAWKNTGGDLYAMADELPRDLASAFNAMAGISESSVNEGRMKDSVIDDSEKMSKEEFAKKHGKELADEMYEAVVSEAPTMDTTQLITLLKNAGLTEEAIERKLTEWANTPSPEMAGEQEPAEHGDAYDFAQSVNLSLKRYLDAEDMKVGLKEHKVEDIREAYEAKKNK